jgi:ribonuclease T2
MTRFSAILAVLAMLAVGASAPAHAEGESGEFDYYTLILSWSPTYCESEGRDRKEPQCSGRRPYAFVLHGFWPQYDRGWPQSCDTGRRTWVDRSVINDMLDIMPSRGLIIHQYRKHGTCSGLGPDDYFALARKAYDAIQIPAAYRKLDERLTTSPHDIEEAFLKANPALRPDMISIDCKRRRLSELRICFTRGLELTSCGPNEQQGKLCSSRQIVMPPVR